MSDNNSNEQYFWNFAYSVLFVALIVGAIYYFNSQKILPRTMPLFDFIILILTTFRLVRLFVYDSITNFIRGHFKQYEQGPGKTMRNLLGCPWCTGIWMAFFASFAYFATPLAWYPLLILALAGAATFIQITILKIGYGL